MTSPPGWKGALLQDSPGKARLAHKKTGRFFRDEGERGLVAPTHSRFADRVPTRGEEFLEVERGLPGLAPLRNRAVPRGLLTRPVATSDDVFGLRHDTLQLWPKE